MLNNFGIFRTIEYLHFRAETTMEKFISNLPFVDEAYLEFPTICAYSLRFVFL